MTMKKMWVPIVSSLVLVVALLALPGSAQAGPVQGADVSVTVSEGPLLDVSSWAQVWSDLLHVVGLGSGSKAQDPADPPTTFGPTSSEELLTEDAPIDDGGDVRGAISPNG